MLKRYNFRTAKDRHNYALHKHFDKNDPYESTRRAHEEEHTLFMQDRAEIERFIEETHDLSQLKILILTKRIQTSDYGAALKFNAADLFEIGWGPENKDALEYRAAAVPFEIERDRLIAELDALYAKEQHTESQKSASYYQKKPRYKIRDAQERYESVLKQIYDPTYHFKSLHKAKVRNWELFISEQHRWNSLIAGAEDSYERKALFLCKEIEYAEYKELATCHEEQLASAKLGDDGAFQRKHKNSWTGKGETLRDELDALYAVIDSFSTKADAYDPWTAPHKDRDPFAGLTTAVKAAYILFGVTPPASLPEIKAKYRHLVKMHHPDVNNGSPQSSAAFIRIGNAYDILCHFFENAPFERSGA